MLYLAGFNLAEVRNALDVDEHHLCWPVMVHPSASVASNQPEVILLVCKLLQDPKELWQGFGGQV